MTRHSRLAAILALAGIAAFAPRRHEPPTVEIVGLRFHPDRLTVAPGDTVIWINRDIVPHTVTGPDGRPDSGEISPGDSFRLAVTTGIGGRYYCRYHPDMTLTLGVD